MSQPLDAPTRVRYVVLGWLCAAAAIAYIQRNCLGVLESTIRAELALTREQMGWVLSIFFFTYAAFQIPSGRLGDRWGARRALPFYSALWSTATVAIIFAGFLMTDSLANLLLDKFAEPDSATRTLRAVVILPLVAGVWLFSARLLAGAAQAGIFPCAAVVMTHWLPTTQRGTASGWIAAAQQVGAILAAALTGALLYALDWRSIFVLYAVPGFLWSIGFFRWYRDRPEEHREVNAGEAALISADKDASITEEKPGGISWSALATSPAIWWICGQQFFRGAGYIFYGTWFPTFLQESRGVSVPESGFLTSLPVLGSLLGALLGGTVSDRILRATGSRSRARRGVAVTGMLSCAGFIFGAWFVHNPVAAVLIISGGAFCASLAGPAGYALTIDMGGRHVATVFATMNMSGNLGAFLFPILVPYLLTWTGDWNLVLVVFGLVYLAAAGCWLLLNPAGTVFDQSRRGGS